MHDITMNRDITRTTEIHLRQQNAPMIFTHTARGPKLSMPANNRLSTTPRETGERSDHSLPTKRAGGGGVPTIWAPRGKSKSIPAKKPAPTLSRHLPGTEAIKNTPVHHPIRPGTKGTHPRQRSARIISTIGTPGDQRSIPVNTKRLPNNHPMRNRRPQRFIPTKQNASIHSNSP